MTLWKKRTATLQLIDDGIKEIFCSETPCWPKFLWKYMYISQSKPKFAHNFIIKCCVSSKERFLRSTEFTWKVMLLQKNPKSSSKYSSSSQFLFSKLYQKCLSMNFCRVLLTRYQISTICFVTSALEIMFYKFFERTKVCQCCLKCL